MHSGPGHTKRESYGRLGGRGTRDGRADGGRIVSASFRGWAGYRSNRPNRIHRLGLCKSERRKKRGELERERVERRCQRVIVRVVEVSTRQIVLKVGELVEMRMDFRYMAIVGMDMLERRQAECGQQRTAGRDRGG